MKKINKFKFSDYLLSIVVIITILLCGLGVFLAIKDIKRGSCELIRPPNALYGTIGGGLVPTYYIFYEGETERTGEECEISFCVSEKKYYEVIESKF